VVLLIEISVDPRRVLLSERGEQVFDGTGEEELRVASQHEDMKGRRYHRFYKPLDRSISPVLLAHPWTICRLLDDPPYNVSKHHAS
jgi:hypothetical protein